MINKKIDNNLKNTSNNLNSLTYYGKDSNIKKAPLLIDSNKLTKIKEKETEKKNEIENNLIENQDEKIKNINIDKNYLDDDNNGNNKKYINNNFLRNRGKKENNNIEEEDNNFIRKGINDNVLSDENMNIKPEEKIKDTNNIKNNYIENK
jgi:hypothetical protein